MSFKNTVIIMTSNIGAHLIANGVSSDGTITDETRDAVMGELKSHFRPEFLNRVDDTILLYFLVLLRDFVSVAVFN